MARILSLGSALQDIYLIDHDDFVGGKVDGADKLTHIDIGSKVDIDKISFEVGGGGTNAAVSFARHGHEAIFTGNIGEGPAKRLKMSSMKRESTLATLFTKKAQKPAYQLFCSIQNLAKGPF